MQKFMNHQNIHIIIYEIYKYQFVICRDIEYCFYIYFILPKNKIIQLCKRSPFTDTLLRYLPKWYMGTEVKYNYYGIYV